MYSRIGTLLYKTSIMYKIEQVIKLQLVIIDFCI